MAGTKREKYKANIVRRRIIELANAGYSVAKIMADTGKSYKHVTAILSQEQHAMYVFKPQP